MASTVYRVEWRPGGERVGVLHGNQGTAMVGGGGMLVLHGPVLVARGIPLDGWHCGDDRDDMLCFCVVAGRSRRGVRIVMDIAEMW